MTITNAMIWFFGGSIFSFIACLFDFYTLAFAIYVATTTAALAHTVGVAAWEIFSDESE